MSLEQVTKADQPATDDDAMLVRVQREDFSIDEELKRVRRRSKRIGGIAMFLGTARDRSKGKDLETRAHPRRRGVGRGAPIALSRASSQGGEARAFESPWTTARSIHPLPQFSTV